MALIALSDISSFFEYWSSLDSEAWTSIFFFSAVFFSLSYFFVYKKIKSIDKSRRKGKIQTAFIIIPLLFLSVLYGYWNESKFKYKTLAWEPAIELLSGNISWYNMGSFFLVILASMSFLGLLKIFVISTKYSKVITE